MSVAACDIAAVSGVGLFYRGEVLRSMVHGVCGLVEEVFLWLTAVGESGSKRL
jgi:hypothetical protein